MRRVVFHYQASPALTRRLRALEQNGLAVEIVAPTDAAALAMALPHTEVLWHVLEPVTAAVIAAAPRLRLIQKIGVGVNTIDLEAARVARHRGLQHAGHQHARRGGADAGPDAGLPAAAA